MKSPRKGFHETTIQLLERASPIPASDAGSFGMYARAPKSSSRDYISLSTAKPTLPKLKFMGET